MENIISAFLKSAIFILCLSFMAAIISYNGKSYAANNSTTVFIYPNGSVSGNITNILRTNGYIIVASPQNANYVINYGQKNPANNEITLLIIPNGNISSNIVNVLQSNNYSVVVMPSQNAANYNQQQNPVNTIPEPVVVPEPYPYPVPYPYYSYPYPDYIVPGILGGILIGGFLYHGFGGHGGGAFRGRGR